MTRTGRKTFATLFGGVHSPKSKRLHEGVSYPYASSAVQNHIDIGAIEAMAVCKSRLAAFVFNCGPQQLNNLVFIKYMRAAAQAAAK
jgi:hypothetical protein